MARTKRSARGAALGLPRAKFTTIKPKKQRNKSLPKLRIDLAPPAASSSAAEDWQQLEPSLPEGSSPEVEAAVDRANKLCPVPGPPQKDVTITDLLDSLTTDPPETRTPSPLPLTRSPRRSPFENGMTEDLPTDVAPSAPATVTAETVRESASPIHAIARKLTVGAPKKRPIATKCPRPEYTKLAPSKASKPKPKEKVKEVAKNRPTALREIKRLQREYKPVLPLAPFARAVRGVLFQFGPYRLTRDALEALRCATEQYGLDTFQSANLLTRHRDRATLQPKDIRMARRIKGEDESVGIAPEAATQWMNDWKAFNEQRLTSKKALYMEAARRRRLREQAQRRLETQRRAIMRN